MRFNYEGDLLFTSGLDGAVNLWYAESGERIGSFEGHRGAVYCVDVTRDSRFLLTASADNTVKLWEATTGKCLATVKHHGPCHGVAWAEGEREFAVIVNKFMAEAAALLVYTFNAEAPEELSAAKPRRVFRDEGGPPADPKCVAWMPMNEGVMVGFDNGVLLQVDPDTGAEMGRWTEAHSERITSLTFNEAKTLMLTSSKDKTVVLWDVKEMAEQRRFVTDLPVNAARLSPLREHLILGGGQEARDVTTTAAAAGKFETRFFDLVMGRELGRVKGHFGPINTVDFSPDGWRFASGSETGNVILYKLDPDYLVLGEDDNLDDPQLTEALEDGTYEKLLEEEQEEKARGQGRG